MENHKTASLQLQDGQPVLIRVPLQLLERGELLREGLQLDHITRTPTNIRHRCSDGYD